MREIQKFNFSPKSWRKMQDFASSRFLKNCVLYLSLAARFLPCRLRISIYFFFSYCDGKKMAQAECVNSKDMNARWLLPPSLPLFFSYRMQQWFRCRVESTLPCCHSCRHPPSFFIFPLPLAVNFLQVWRRLLRSCRREESDCTPSRACSDWSISRFYFSVGPLVLTSLAVLVNTQLEVPSLGGGQGWSGHPHEMSTAAETPWQCWKSSTWTYESSAAQVFPQKVLLWMMPGTVFLNCIHLKRKVHSHAGPRNLPTLSRLPF